MKQIVTLLCFAGALMPVMILPAAGQSSTFSAGSSAAATATTASSGRPSTFAIKQNFLAMQLAAIERQIRDARRCIQNATNPVTLRDPEGNINRVPQTDAVDCGRKLEQLLRQLENLRRKSDVLARDAAAQAAFFERQAREAERKARTAPLNRSSAGGE